MTDFRQQILAALKDFDTYPLPEAATRLFTALGYKSDRVLPVSTVSQFCREWDGDKILTAREREALDQLTSLHLLFQLTDAELTMQRDLLDHGTGVDGTRIHSYLFFAAELPPGLYTRTFLSGIARAINKPLAMPAMVLFRHGDYLSLAIIHRRLNRRQADRDVLEKTTLIKDVRVADPIRAHLEILNDFAFANLDEFSPVHNFVTLHKAWQDRLDTYSLNDRFYQEIADWYFWAKHLIADGTIIPPPQVDTDPERSLFLIRMLTRLIFCWFLQEKRLLPGDLFREHRLKALLRDFTPGTDPRKPDLAPSYYRAILQNLFFATLNQPPQDDDGKPIREFRERTSSGRFDPNRGITNLWRYKDYFRDPAEWPKLSAVVPFLNGGLFDCLDQKFQKTENRDNVLLDGFSDNPAESTVIPNDLFFGPDRAVDLSTDYGEQDKRTARSKKAKVRGLIHILSRYKFTMEENTPLDQEIALDPELLGKVFENLLASYNPETRDTARKQTGSFYTPREVVSFMVDEALIAYLDFTVGQTILSGQSGIKPLNAAADISRARRHLPHWTQDGVTYWITFRLADSLPAEKLRQWQEERATWVAQHPEPWSDMEWEEYDECFGRRVEEWLDAGQGECQLGRADVRGIVEQCIQQFDGERYDVHGYVVMPNHVHLLLRPHSGYKLSAVMQGIKGVSSRRCNELLGRKGSFWQDESFDHVVRSEAQFTRFRRYIDNNPARAGLPRDRFSVYPAGPSGEGQTGLSVPLLDRLRSLFAARVDDYEPDFDDAETDRLVTALDGVKVFDPACGSGAYPMGALHRLVDLLRKLDPENKRWETRQRARLAEEKAKAEKLDDPELKQEALAGVKRREAEFKALFNVGRFDRDYARKLFLIENAIFGSDIQPVAVQIAKLRFFIALICDQKIDPKAPNQGVLPLPNLETRIVAANTLMPIPETAVDGHVADLFDAEVRKHRARLQEVRHEHFAARHPATKRRCREKDAAIRKELADLLQREAHLDRKVARMLADWDPYDQNTFAPFFDPAWMFGDAYTRGSGGTTSVSSEDGRDGARPSTRGFDIAIANPPYVRQEKIKDQKDDLKPHYPETFTGTADLYVYFYERALQLLRPGGVLSYISSNKWYRAAYGEKLRAHLGKTATLIHAIDFGDAPVFTAIAYPTIVIARKAAPSSKHMFRALNWDPATPNTEIANFAAFYASKASRVAQSSLSDKTWKFGERKREELIDRIRGVGKPLRKYVNSRLYRGLTTGLNDAFVVDETTRDRLIAEHKSSAELLHPYIRGKDVKPWTARSGREFILRIPSSENEQHPWSGKKDTDAERTFAKTYPAVHAFQQQFRDAMKERYDQGHYHWELRACAYWKQFELPKIVSTKVSIRPTFALDQAGCFVGNTVYFFPVESDSLYLLALLHSAVSFAYAKRAFVEKQNGWYEVQPEGLEAFPVPEANPDQKTIVEAAATCVQHLYKVGSETKPIQPRDPLMRDYYEQILNALVYELYLTEDVHGAGLRFFDLVEAANLPRVDPNARDKDAQLTALRRKFEDLYAPSHSLRAALQKLHTLEPIRIIEGKV